MLRELVEQRALLAAISANLEEHQRHVEAVREWVLAELAEIEERRGQEPVEVAGPVLVQTPQEAAG